MSKEELGTLVVVVLKAQNLNDKYFWKQDVFAQVSLNGEAKRTHVEIKGGQHPVWDEEIRIPIMKDTQEKYRKLEVSCWAKETKKEENIGTGVLDISQTLKTGEFDDWVSLQSNGTTRGELYLEMTFYANAPPPSHIQSGLSVPKYNTGNLQRRPSKLSPSERLARPRQTEVLPLVGHQQTPSHNLAPNGRSPPSSGANSPPRHGRESSLPPVPEQVTNHPTLPGALTAGRPRPQPGATLGQGLAPHPQAQGLTPHVPSILRPRNPKSSPTPIPGPRVEYSGVVPSQDQDEGYEQHRPGTVSPPRTYTPVVPPADAPSYGDYFTPPQPQRWGSGDDAPTDFSFPVPTLPGAHEPTTQFSNTPPYNPPVNNYSPQTGHQRNGSGGTPAPPAFPPQNQPSYPPPTQPLYPPQTPSPYPPHQPSYPPPPQSIYPPQQQQSYPPQQPPSFQQPPFQAPSPPGGYPISPPPAQRNNDLPDPYLLARYQSPLPLPPGAENNTPRQRATSTSQPPHEAPPKHPQQQQQSLPASQMNPDNARMQALRQVEEEAARKRAEEERRAEERRAEERRAEERRAEERRAEERRAEERRAEERRAEERRAEERREREAAQQAAEEERKRKEEARIQALKEAEEEAARKKAQEKREREAAQRAIEEEKKRKEQEARIKALKKIEEEAARKRAQEQRDREYAQRAADEENKQREQEERDMELARQLDRELNLGIGR